MRELLTINVIMSMTTITHTGIAVMTTAMTPTYTAACDSVVSGTKRVLAFTSETRQTHILTIQELHRLQVACFMFKVDKGLIPPYFSSVFCTNANVHSYNTRFATNYHCQDPSGPIRGPAVF